MMKRRGMMFLLLFLSLFLSLSRGESMPKNPPRRGGQLLKDEADTLHQRGNDESGVSSARASHNTTVALQRRSSLDRYWKSQHGLRMDRAPLASSERHQPASRLLMSPSISGVLLRKRWSWRSRKIIRETLHQGPRSTLAKHCLFTTKGSFITSIRKPI